jgi:hypothetical protein
VAAEVAAEVAAVAAVAAAVAVAAVAAAVAVAAVAVAAVAAPYSERRWQIRDAVYPAVRAKVREILAPTLDELLPSALDLLDRMLPPEPLQAPAIPNAEILFAAPERKAARAMSGEPRQISQDDYLKLLGLMTLAKEYHHMGNELERAMRGLVGEVDDKDKAAGWVSDAVWGYDDPDPRRAVQRILDGMKLTVAPESVS